jgi:hypothetical protein
MSHPGPTLHAPNSLTAKTWRKLVGQVRIQARYKEGKLISWYAYIDYGVTSKWFGN